MEHRLHHLTTTGIMDAVSAISDYSLVKTMDKDEAVKEGLYVQIGKEVDDKYIAALKSAG